MSIINYISGIDDVIRGTLIADRPEQIPKLLSSVTEKVTAQGGKFYIANKWGDSEKLLKGYVGVHIKIRMPLDLKKIDTADGRTDLCQKEHILMELQLHLRQIVDGTKDCAKEIAHRLYKEMPEETAHKFFEEIYSSSQLIYLVAMLTLSTSKKMLDNLKIDSGKCQDATECDNEVRFHVQMSNFIRMNPQLSEPLCGEWGDWNKRLKAMVPKEDRRELVAKLWRKEAENINKTLNLPIVKKDQGEWTNTARSINELYFDANRVANFFQNMCFEVAASQGCSYSFGPENKHMIKEKPSLLNNIKKKCEKELAHLISQLGEKLGRSLLEFKSEPLNLSTLHSLDLINIYEYKITDSDLGLVGRITTLKNLKIKRLRITDRGLANLSGLTGLQNLDLEWCLRISNRGLESLRGLTGLQSLNLSGCYKITDKGLITLNGLTGLQILDFSDCDEITDKGLANLKDLNRLQELKLNYCTRITVKGLTSLVHFPVLSELNLWECQITDRGLDSLGSSIQWGEYVRQYYMRNPQLHVWYGTDPSPTSKRYHRELTERAREILLQS